MLFAKQDIMQSTLAGETPPVSRSYCSLSGGPSVVAWSPIPNSPTYGIPSFLSQHIHYQYPQYLAPKNSLDELSACLSNEEIQSILGEDLDTHSAKSQLQPPLSDSNPAVAPPPLLTLFLTPDPVAVPPHSSKSYVTTVDLPSQLKPSQSCQTFTQGGYPPLPSDSSKRAGNLLPLSLCDQAGTQCVSMNTDCDIPELGQETPSQEGVCSNTLGKGMTTSQSPPPCRSADDSFFTQTFNST